MDYSIRQNKYHLVMPSLIWRDLVQSRVQLGAVRGLCNGGGVILLEPQSGCKGASPRRTIASDSLPLQTITGPQLILPSGSLPVPASEGRSRLFWPLDHGGAFVG